jgi:hypothetical protein
MRELVSAVRAFKSEFGKAARARALRHDSTVVGLLSLTRRALARTHLVHVASTLGRELGFGPDQLGALKIPVDLLNLFPGWRSGSTSGFRPPHSRLVLLPESCARPIGALRLQVSPAAGPVAIAATMLGDLRRTLDPAVRIVTLLDPDTDAREIRRLARVVVGRPRRMQFQTVDFASVFARDNAMAAHDLRGRPVLVIPRAFRITLGDDVRPLDAAAATRRLGVRVVWSRLYWHGGNILFDGETLAIGADTIAENTTRLGLARHEVIAILSAELGHPVTVLGDAAEGRFDHDRNRMTSSGQASYHVDLDVALLGRTPRHDKTALVADLGLGLDLLPAALERGDRFGPPYLSSAKAKALIAREYRRTARRHGPVLEAYSRSLASSGYRVVRVPQLQTRETENGVGGLPGQDVVYCNVLPGLNRGRPSVHYAPWGVPRLDAAAEQAFLDAGVQPVRVSRTPYLASAMMSLAAGLRCFCGTFPLAARSGLPATRRRT